jgi:Zn-finger nucleic acid-binding protein
MLCPNCSEELHTVQLSNQLILHCSHCGGSFFEENAINRITVEDAEVLFNDKKRAIVQSNPKICPHDNIFLRCIDQDEAIPSNVTLFKCPHCRGIYADPDDVAKFKKAQDIKIAYFKVWNNPLPSLRAVLVLSLLLLFSFGIFMNLNNPQLPSSHAEDIASSIHFAKIDNYMFVTFNTASPFKSSIFIKDRTDNSEKTIIISDKAATFHYGTLPNIMPDHDLYYQLLLEDADGKVITTQLKKLEFK